MPKFRAVSGTNSRVPDVASRARRCTSTQTREPYTVNREL